MITHNLGYPRIGSRRELKKGLEQFWAGKISQDELQTIGRKIRHQNWQMQSDAGLTLIPSNDFSFYDHVLDTALMVGAIPERYQVVVNSQNSSETDVYFAMARGLQTAEADIGAMEMTKWFDTNYHYIVPEFTENQVFTRYSDKIIHDFEDAKQLDIISKPVLVGPVTFLLLGKEKASGFYRIDLLDKILPIYVEILQELAHKGATWVQIDEPYLSLDLSENEKVAFQKAYQTIKENVPSLKILLATYFECTGDNINLATTLPIDCLHIDLVRCPAQLGDILETPHFVKSDKILSLVM